MMRTGGRHRAAVDVDRYRREGLTVADARLPDDVLARISRELARYLPDDPAATPDFVPDLMADGFGLRYGSHPLILEAVRQVIGDDVVLWACGLFGKPARVGKPTPWHQDGHYWPITPLATCTVWLALDRSDESNGAMRYVAGSHLPGALVRHESRIEDDATLNQALRLDEAQQAAVRCVELEPGRFSLHDVFLIHGSAPNRSGARRAGLTFRYMPTTSYYDRALARRQHRELGVPDISARVLYLVHGTDRTGRNETVDCVASSPWAEPQDGIG